MHLHTIGRSPCAKVDERTIAKAYAAQNYDGIVITNHFNRYLCDEYYKKGSPSDNVLFWLEAYYTLKRECAVYGGREKALLSKLAASASLGNAVLNCSAQRLVSPCVARAGCGAYQVLYAVLIVT